MRLGKVKFFKSADEWGMITPLNGKPDVFFMQMDCANGVAPAEDTPVRFTLVFNEKGKRKAIGVRAVKFDFDCHETEPSAVPLK